MLAGRPPPKKASGVLTAPWVKQRKPAARGALVVPAGALALLARAVEDPGTRIDFDREDSAEKAGILHKQQLCEPRKEQLVLNDPVLDAGLMRQSRQFHRFLDAG